MSAIFKRDDGTRSNLYISLKNYTPITLAIEIRTRKQQHITADNGGESCLVLLALLMSSTNCYL